MLILLPFQAEACGESKCPNCLFRVHCCKWLVTTTRCLSAVNSPGGVLIYTTESGKARLVASSLLAIQNHVELFWKTVLKTTTNPLCVQVWDPWQLQPWDVCVGPHPPQPQGTPRFRECGTSGLKRLAVLGLKNNSYMFCWLLLRLYGILISLICVGVLNILHHSAFQWDLFFAWECRERFLWASEVSSLCLVIRTGKTL